MRKANFTSFPSNSPGKPRAVFKPYLGVKSKFRKKKTDYIQQQAESSPGYGNTKVRRAWLKQNIHCQLRIAGAVPAIPVCGDCVQVVVKSYNSKFHVRHSCYNSKMHKYLSSCFVNYP